MGVCDPAGGGRFFHVRPENGGVLLRAISGVMAFVDGRFVPSDILIDGGKIVSVSPAKAELLDKALYVMPGFTDVHVHLREPGFSYT